MLGMVCTLGVTSYCSVFQFYLISSNIRVVYFLDVFLMSFNDANFPRNIWHKKETKFCKENNAKTKNKIRPSGIDI